MNSPVTQIKERLTIEEVVSSYIKIERAGANFKARCPFHNEKTPSFTVSPSKGIFKCFGCGKGGNSVNFIMEHEHLSYPEALKYLASKYHIEIEEKDLSESFFRDTIEGLLKDKAKLKALGDAAKSLSAPLSSEKLADMVTGGLK